ncbi:hypothetical protein FS837_009600 [Tulasnella sp. UAMH 9824]|nr:hypothetical protein FS837_009600 [Tulasnella sp. UAMH 9824]
MASNATDVLVIQHNATNVLDLQDATHNYTINATDQDVLPTIATALPNLVKTMEPVLSNSYLQSSLNFFFFGTVLETGRRLWQFLMDKFTGGFVLTAIFDSSDPAYEWFFSYLNDEKIWSSTREFRVTARTTSRTWGVNSASNNSNDDEGYAEYTPSYDQPQLFKYQGTYCQVTRTKPEGAAHGLGHEDGGQLVLTLYTRNRSVLDNLISHARAQYLKKSKPRLVVHGTDHCGSWCQVTTKARRPLDSLILPTGVKEMLLHDARDFLRSEQWYADAGIQHKRGYLLYGPPGTGKSSTIHALAGELDLEIYALSLAANGMDDAGLSRLIGSTPAHSIILIEDIDCAFPSREEKKRQKEAKEKGIVLAETQSRITLSGLLNVIDGVSSEEGRLLFATTNYVNRLDPALLRAGRMDVKIHYKMSTQDQIVNLFKRFYPAQKEEAPAASDKKARRISDLELTPPPTPSTLPADSTSTDPNPNSDTASPKFAVDTTPIYPPRLPRATIDELAERFASLVPQNKFTVAELQGYLLTVKTRPYEAVDGVVKWMEEVEEERERMRKEKEEEEKREEEEEKKEKEEKEKAEKKEKEDQEKAEKKAKEEQEKPEKKEKGDEDKGDDEKKED